MADVQPREAAPPATSAVPNGSPAVAAPKPELDATVLAQPSPRVESTPRQEPAPPPNAANLQAPIAAPVAADSRAGAEWTGDDGERQDAPGSRGGAAAGAAPTSERASASFVVPQPTTPAFTSTDGVVPEGSGASVMGRSGELDQAGVENQLVQSMRTLWRGGVSEARVTLRPEYLGAVTISLRLESGGLHAHLRVEDPQVGAWVQANEASLKHALAGQGLTLERLVVSDDSGARDQQAQQGERDRRGARRQAPGNADAARFTINV